MKAYRVNEDELWAHHSLEQLRVDYKAETGEDIDDDADEVSDEFLDALIPEYDENEAPTGEKTTLRRYLNEMTEPGFLAGTL